MSDLIPKYLLSIKDLINKYYLVNEDLELEFRLGTFSKSQVFTKGNIHYDPTNISKFRSNISKQEFEKFKNSLVGKKVKEETITFISDNLRLTRNYSTKKKIIESKTRLAKFDMPELNMRLSISRETKLDENSTKNEKFNVIRYKNRESIIINNWRYDLSEVVQKNMDVGGIGLKNMVDNIRNEEPNSYEVEIEYIGKDKNKVINDIEVFIKNNSDTHNDDEKINEVKNLINSKKIFNNPITFLKHNIGDIEINNYASTEKADGERRLLYKDINGSTYYITTYDKVFKAPDLNAPNGTVIDGEYIDNKKFLAFDILVYNNKSIIDLNLENRLKKLKEVKGASYEMKKFYLSKQPLNIYELNKKVLSAKYKYDIDGLILTPINAPYFNNATFKWKEPTMTSTDFLVKHNLGAKSPWELYVGITGGLMKKIGITLPEDFSMRFPDIDIDSNYYPVLFKPKDMPLAYQLNYSDKQIKEYGIEDDTIIELVLIDGKWKFIKTREDKTKSYRDFKGNFGNNWMTAESNLYSIMNPITKEIITGKVKSSFFTDSGKNSNIIGMRKFHTFIKSLTYNKFADGAKWLLEIGAGRFGDLIRWSDNNIKNIVALDVDKDAIEEGKKRLTVFKNNKNKIGNVYSGVFDLTTDEWNGAIEQTIAPLKIVKFDAVMIHFAIHFFMSGESYVDMMVKNLMETTKKGSFVVITAMDGAKIVKLLSNTDKGAIYEIKKKDKTIFGLRKEYEGTTLVDMGQQISVYVESIGNYNDEYLVNFEFLKEKMKDGFNVYEELDFEKLYPKWKKNKNKNIPDMTKEEKEYSYLWKLIIFERK